MIIHVLKNFLPIPRFRFRPEHIKKKKQIKKKKKKIKTFNVIVMDSNAIQNPLT